MTDDDGDSIVVVAKGRLYLIPTHIVFCIYFNTKSSIRYQDHRDVSSRSVHPAHRIYKSALHPSVPILSIGAPAYQHSPSTSES
jgi:hypothetical protein